MTVVDSDTRTSGNHTDIIINDVAIKSNNGRYFARMQDDGDFVLYNSLEFLPRNQFWSTGTKGKGVGPFRILLQTNGNLVIYGADDKMTWESNTAKNSGGPFRLIMQNDRNLVIYNVDGLPTWASKTHI